MITFTGLALEFSTLASKVSSHFVFYSWDFHWAGAFIISRCGPWCLSQTDEFWLHISHHVDDMEKNFLPWDRLDCWILENHWIVDLDDTDRTLWLVTAVNLIGFTSLRFGVASTRVNVANQCLSRCCGSLLCIQETHFDWLVGNDAYATMVLVTWRNNR